MLVVVQRAARRVTARRRRFESARQTSGQEARRNPAQADGPVYRHPV